MRGLGLKTRYVLIVLAIGLVLTTSVALIIAFSERHEPRHQIAWLLGTGLVLTLLGAWVTARMISRIDRGMAELMTRAERIGRGVYSDPIPRSDVPEIAPLAKALEQMRQALTGTAISRNYLDTLLNSMSLSIIHI